MVDLASTLDVEAAIGRELDGAETTRAVQLLGQASAVIRRLALRTFDATVDETVTLDGTGTRLLVLPQTPVTAVASVAQDGVTLTADDYQWNENGLLRRVHGRWTGGYRAIEVTYSHGYAETPDDLTQVCAAMVARYLENPMGYRSETLGDYAYTLAGATQPGLAPYDHERDIILSYRPPVVA